MILFLVTVPLSQCVHWELVGLAPFVLFILFPNILERILAFWQQDALGPS